MKYRFLNCQPVKVSYILFRVLVYEILVGVPMIGGILVLSSMKQHDVIKKRIQFWVKWQIVIWNIYRSLHEPFIDMFLLLFFE